MRTRYRVIYRFGIIVIGLFAGNFAGILKVTADHEFTYVPVSALHPIVSWSGAALIFVAVYVFFVYGVIVYHWPSRQRWLWPLFIGLWQITIATQMYPAEHANRLVVHNYTLGDVIGAGVRMAGVCGPLLWFRS